MRGVARVPRAVLLGAFLLGACGGGEPAEEASGEAMEAEAPTGDDRSLQELWNEGVTAFGVYVPQEQYTRSGAATVAANPLYDYLFLNLEGEYDPTAVENVAAGVRMAELDAPPSLLVRIPPISAEGAEIAGARVDEIIQAGADGVVLPHIRNVEEARTAIGFFEEYDVWSPSNPDGTVLAMIMVEDPEAIEQLDEIIAIGDYSVLACGIGSLTGALDGDRETAEAMCHGVLEAATEAGYADMMTANADNVESRVSDGYLAVLMFGPEVIRMGRAAAGR